MTAKQEIFHGSRVPTPFSRLEQGSKTRSEKVTSLLARDREIQARKALEKEEKKPSFEFALPVPTQEITPVFGEDGKIKGVELTVKEGNVDPFISSLISQGHVKFDVKPVGKEPELSPASEEKEKSNVRAMLQRLPFAASVVGLLGGSVGVAQEIHAQTPPPAPGIHETTNGINSQTVYNESVLDDREIKPEATPGPFGPELEVTQEWLLQNPRAVKAFYDVKDQNGKIIRKLAIVGKKLFPETDESHDFSLYATDTKADDTFTSYKYLSPVPIAMPRCMTAEGDFVVIGGEAVFRTALTGIAVSRDKGKTFNVIPWPSELQSPSGAVSDLKIISNTNDTLKILGTNAFWEGGVGKWIMTINKNTGQTQLQAITEKIQATNLKSSGNPQILSISGNELTLVGLSFARNLSSGIDVEKINIQKAEGTTTRYLGPQMGIVESQASYQKDGKDYHLFGNYPLDPKQNLHKVEFNVQTKVPITDTLQSVNSSKWMDNQDIPNILKEHMSIYSLGNPPLVDSQGKTHIWFIGIYVTSPDSNNHAFIGHLIEGTDPATDKTALFWKDLGPIDLDMGGVSQSQLQFKIVNGQPGFEVAVYAHDRNPSFKYGGLIFFPINSDGSPKQGAELIYPNKGLETEAQATQYKIYIPLVTKGAVGGW